MIITEAIGVPAKNLRRWKVKFIFFSIAGLTTVGAISSATAAPQKHYVVCNAFSEERNENYFSKYMVISRPALVNADIPDHDLQLDFKDFVSQTQYGTMEMPSCRFFSL